MKIPNAEFAVVDIEKLVGYCLNMDHPYGGHKARVFSTALGIKDYQAKQLKEALLYACQHYEAMPAEKDTYGQRYVLDFPMEGKEGMVWVRSLWIIRKMETFPRLTSCFVLKRKM